MDLKSNLKFIEMSKDFEVKEVKDGIYEIQFNDSKEYDITASVDVNKEEISYFVSDCYNSGNDWIEIDIERLKKMMTYVKLIGGAK